MQIFNINHCINVKYGRLTGDTFFFPTGVTLVRPLADKRPPSRPPAGFAGAGAGVTGAATSSS